jgi:hypothetical protein
VNLLRAEAAAPGIQEPALFSAVEILQPGIKVFAEQPHRQTVQPALVETALAGTLLPVLFGREETVLQTIVLTAEESLEETADLQAVPAAAVLATHVLDGLEEDVLGMPAEALDVTPLGVTLLMPIPVQSLTQQVVQDGILETVLFLAEETAEPTTQHSA